jgi:thiol:disulfide interchange protein DsbD
MMTHRIYLFLLTAFISISGFAQDSLKWDFNAVKTGEGNYRLKIRASIPAGTIIYSNRNKEDLPSTTFEFDSSISNKVQIKGDEQPSVLKKKDIQLDGASVYYFEKEFAVDLDLTINEPLPYLKGKVQYMGFDGKIFLGPTDVEFYLKQQADGSYSGGEFSLTTSDNDLHLQTVDLNHPVNTCGIEQKKQSSLFSLFILGFLGGLLALLTPCVFPMIPLTVSFFTKKNASEKSKGIRSALLYGFFIFLIYISFSIPFHIIGNVSPTIYNDISTNIWLNIIFFAIFIVFAVSFFGYFEITLPSGLANKVGARNGSNIIGILFMSLTLAIVSFSCTGPILGALLVGTVSGGAWPLTAGLAGFGLALGLPFALFAMFPHWLHSLPRSGGWMNTVKVVLGFIELALALKFLSNADLVIHWGLLKRELFIAIWMLMGLGLFIYLMGWLKFPHDDARQKIKWPRKIFALLVLAFVIYLTPGLTNTRYANLSLVSGFPPPACYSLYSHPVNCDEPLKDYDEALKLAKEKNKPLMIDFTGWACVNCRKMEENVWPKPKVKEMMDKFMLVSLYVDDRTALPVEKQFLYKTKDGAEKKIITVGDKWATFQTENFNASSQPWYVLLSPDGKLLNPPLGYTPDNNGEAFRQWLQCGYEAFEKLTKK